MYCSQDTSAAYEDNERIPSTRELSAGCSLWEGALVKTHAGILSEALTQIICLKLNVTTYYPYVTPAAEI